jgi:Kef-type K+ transport system membrane component KefB
MSDSSILPVRISILILLGLVSLANELGMELVLGAYTAGMVIAMLTKVKILQYRLTSLGSGFFILLFFITSGVEFDLRRVRKALPASSSFARAFSSSASSR